MTRGPRHRRGLFWQVYLHGLLLLALVAASVLIAGVVIGRKPPGRLYPERLGAYLSSRSDDLLFRPAELARDLRREHELLGVQMSIYASDGRLLATNVEPPVPALDARDVARLDAHPVRFHRSGMRLAVPVLRDGRMVAYAALGAFRPAEHLLHAGFVLAFVLAALALMSTAVARRISSPLEKLTATAQRLGAGDLSARTGALGPGEVGRLGRALDDMAERIQSLLRAEKELLANVSHELRTPLARMRIALELAAEGDHQAAHRSLQELDVDVAELERLVDSVLAVSRLDLMGGTGGAPPLALEPCQPGTLVEAAASRFRTLHPERPLGVEVSPGLPQVSADVSLMGRVLDNLLDNSAKYSDASTPITIAALGSDAGVAFEVRDRGTGIDSAELPHLFRPFFRAAAARRARAAGVGLGLALVKRITEAHGGSVQVTSRVGEGTTMRVLLPAAGSARA